MNPEQTRLRHEQQTAATEAVHDTSQQQAVEFASVEELLRSDSQQNPVPPEVAERLNQSIAAEPVPEKSWIKRIFH
jgi:hypothetical protein